MTSDDNRLLMAIPFSGFYYSQWDDLMERKIEADACYLIQHDERFIDVDIEDVKQAVREQVDWEGARTVIARHYADAFWKRIERELGVLDETFAWEFESLRSPREYNFMTDRVFVKVPRLTMSHIGYLTDTVVLERLVKDHCTDRSGFISYYSNKLDDWFEKPFTCWSHNQLEIVLLAWLETRGVDAEALESEIMEEMEQGGVFAVAMPLDEDAAYASLAEIAN